MRNVPKGWSLIYQGDKPVLIDEHGIRWVPEKAKRSPYFMRTGDSPGYPFCDQWSCPPHLSTCKSRNENTKTTNT